MSPLARLRASALVSSMAMACLTSRLPAQDVVADSAYYLAKPLPMHAWALGYSPAAGLLGAEVTVRLRKSPESISAGFGALGGGVRINRELRKRPEGMTDGSGVMPYAAVGATWVNFLFWTQAPMVNAETGVQLWPMAGGGLYGDVGIGVGRVWWRDAPQTMPLIHFLIGHTW